MSKVAAITVARKPLAEVTVWENVRIWHAGALNIDACRIAYLSEEDRPTPVFAGRKGPKNGGKYGNCGDYWSTVSSIGRFPANIFFSHTSGCGEMCALNCPVSDMSKHVETCRNMSKPIEEIVTARLFKIFQ